MLAEIPPSLSWDETAVGYNAYTIAHWAKDEWGRTLPLVFKSFEDDKHPVHIYTTAFFVRIFGLSDFTTRLPSALFGVFNVVLIFFLGRILFKSGLVGALAALILAVSPYNLQFSRFNHELNFAVFYFMLGLLLFYKGLEKKNYLLPASFASFGISLLSYHSAKIVVPPLVLLLIALHFKKLLRVKKMFFISLGVLLIFATIIVSDPRLLGLARFRQTALSGSNLDKLKVIVAQYSWHFKPGYLFISGDKNPRHSIQTVGEFYKTDAPFLVLGAAFLIWQILRKKSKEAVLLLAWALLAPVPSAAVSEAPHAARAMFMTGSWHLIIALGITQLVIFVKKPILRIIVLGIFMLVLGIYFKNYLSDYYGGYAKKYAIEWQYGLKKAVLYLQQTKGVEAVYMTNVRQQPYIFVLNYLKYSLPAFLKSVNYNTTPSRSFSTVESFGKYHFLNDLDFTYMPAADGIYYVITPSEYDGLASKDQFSVRKLIKYPNGSDAFYIVTAK